MASVIVISKLIHSELFLKHSSNAIKVLLYLLSIKNKYTSYDDLVKVIPNMNCGGLNIALCELKAAEYIIYSSIQGKIKLNYDKVDFVINTKIRAKKKIKVDPATRELFNLFSSKFKFMYLIVNKKEFPLQHITGVGYPTPHHIAAFGGFCEKITQMFGDPPLPAFFDTYISFLLNDGQFKHKVTSYWIVIAKGTLEVFRASKTEIQELDRFDVIYERDKK